MAASTDEVALQIRKLRKKLRQIENLERSNRELSEEEEIKIEKKASIREELLDLLEEQGEVTPLYEQRGDTTLESESSSSILVTDVSPERADSDSPDIDSGQDASNIQMSEGQQQSTSDESKKSGPLASPSKRKVLSSADNESVSVEPRSVPESKKAKKEAIKSPQSSLNAERKRWRLAEFQVDFLEGHSDLITSVDTDGITLVSASRDTTVKVWNIDKCEETRNLGGHTNIVTSVQLLLSDHSQAFSEMLEDVTGECDDQFVISGSLDCSLRVWSISTGQTVKRIYTFDPITKLQYVPDLKAVFTGSVGGKISMWNLTSGEAIHSVCAHQEAITGLKFFSGFLYTSSEDGMIKVHEVREQSLSCVFVSENVLKCDGSHLTLRSIHDLEVRDNKVFYGDDRENLKILDWKTGTVSKLRNNISEFGSTDTVCVEGDILLTSGYDLDNGLAFLNVRSFLEKGEYLATLSDDDTGRVLSLACHEGPQNQLVIISGGVELKVWKLTKRSSMEDDLVPTRFLSHLSQTAIDSDQDSESDVADSDDEGQERGPGRRTKRLSLESLGKAGENTGWTSWCSLL